MTKRHKWTAKQRAEIFRDAGGFCHICERRIATGEPWEVEHVKPLGLNGSDKQADMRPAHVDCHKGKTRHDVGVMRKADRQMKKHIGLKRRTGAPVPGSKASKWKKKMDGTVERRLG